MKIKSTLLISVLLLSASAKAQFAGTPSVNHAPLRNQFAKEAGFNAPKTAHLAASPAPAAVIWSDDFSTPANWVMANSGTPPLNWVIGTNIPTSLSTQGFANIASTSGGNFAYYDSDRGVTSGTGLVDNANLTTAASINLSGHPDVILEFQQNYRKFQDSTRVLISTDGVNYTPIRVNENYASGQKSTNPELVRLNISLIAGNQPTVWIRFNYMGGWDWFWMLDDVRIIDAPTHDLEVSSAYIDFNYLNGGYYTQTPYTQVGPLTFRCGAYNIGASTEYQVKTNVAVTGGLTAYNHDSPILDSIEKVHRDTMYIAAAAYTPDKIANYSAAFTISQAATDDVPASNLRTRTFAVTDTIYARDNGITANATIESPAYFTGGDVDGSRLLQLYEMNLNAEANSISVYVNSACDANSGFTGKIFDASGTNEILTTADYAVMTPSSDAGKWVTLPFIKNGVSEFLSKDTAYLVGIESFGNPNILKIDNDVTTWQPDQTCFIYLAGSSMLYYTNSNPFIRLNIRSGYVGTRDPDLKGGFELYQNQPNPFKNNTSISYELVQNVPVALTITDILGREVSTKDEGIQTEGRHSIIVDAKDLGTGMFFYTLKAGNSVHTKKLLVTN